MMLPLSAVSVAFTPRPIPYRYLTHAYPALLLACSALSPLQSQSPRQSIYWYQEYLGSNVEGDVPIAFDRKHSFLFYSNGRSGSNAGFIRAWIHNGIIGNDPVELAPNPTSVDRIMALAVDAPSATAGSTVLYFAYKATGNPTPVKIGRMTAADSCTTACNLEIVTTWAADANVNDGVGTIYTMVFSTTEGFPALYFTVGGRAGVSSYALSGSTAAATLTAAGTRSVSVSPQGDLWLAVCPSGGAGPTSLLRASGPGLQSQSPIAITGLPTLGAYEPCGIAASANDHLVVCMVSSGETALVVARNLDSTPQFAWSTNPLPSSYFRASPYAAFVAVDTDDGSSQASVAMTGYVQPQNNDPYGFDCEMMPWTCRRERRLQTDGYQLYFGDAQTF